MPTYKPGDVATALGVSISSVRNWTDQPEFQPFLSEMARRDGTYSTAKQREYTQQDLYVLNTISRQKNRFNTWEDIAGYLMQGHLDTDLPPSAALVQPTAAESFADAIMLRQQIDMLAKTLSEAEDEINYLRDRMDAVREEEQTKAREREERFRAEIVELNRQIVRLETRMEMMQSGDSR